MLARLFGKRAAGDALDALYAAIVARARDPDWYRAGRVPDTLDGRFDMVAAILALVLLRMEAEGEPGREPAARLAERFIADMDAQLREEGVGDVVVGKHVGRMLGALGGRLDAYRAGLAGGDLEGALARNLYRGVPPDAAALAHVAGQLRALHAALANEPLAALLAGRLP